jgi:hypothetical protein
MADDTDENVIPHSYTYFDVDGSYGCAHPDCLKIMDTTKFTDEDWEQLSVANDSKRMELAVQIFFERNPELAPNPD